MLALLPLLVAVLFGVLAFLRSGSPDARPAFLAAALTWGVLVAAITELLSLFGALAFRGVLAAWVLAAGAAAVLLWRWLRQAGTFPAPALPALSGRFDAVLMGGLALIGIVTLIIALAAPPNNWDSLVYHMARVVHWIQNGTVAHYPTHIIRQLYQPPWAEYAITQFQILQGGDRFANLVQWFSLAGCVIGASFIAAQLGVSPRGQLLAAVVTATIPMAILQASSTQNDLVTAFWMVCAACCTLDAAKNGPGRINTPGFGASLGLALLTKGTAYFFALPFAAAFALIGLRRASWRFWRQAALITLLVAALNAGHLIRNQAVFGTPFGEPGLYANRIFGPAPLASNVIRGLMSNVYAPAEPLDQTLNRAVDAVHGWLGLSSSDPRTTFPGNRFAVRAIWTASGVSPKAFHEDTAGNTLHLALILLSLLLLLARRRLRASRLLLGYAGLITAGFLIFAASVSWQPWITRLQLPLFVLSGPLAAAALADLPRRAVSDAVAALLIAGALPFLFINFSRPALPKSIRTLTHERAIFDARTDQLFTNQPHLQPLYEETVSIIADSGCRQIGLISIESWEYPLWVLLREQPGTYRIEHVRVVNPSRSRASVPRHRDFSPCLIVVLDRDTDATLTLDGVPFTRVLDSPAVAVFRLDDG